MRVAKRRLALGILIVVLVGIVTGIGLRRTLRVLHTRLSVGVTILPFLAGEL